jgi:hypothetical protein
MSHVRTRSRLPVLGTVTAVGVAIGISALLVVGLDGGDSQAARDPKTARTNTDIAAARFEAVQPAPRTEVAKFEQRIPSELFAAPQSVAPPMSAQKAAIPAPPAPEVTASVPRIVGPVPLPPRRHASAPKPDPNRKETASAEIARIKATLKLTPAQEQYWPPVEAALRDILTQIGYEHDHPHGAPKTAQAKRPAAPAQIDPDRVQRLTSAALPLLMTFDEKQKSEVRRLARIMGLENVASAI